MHINNLIRFWKSYFDSEDHNELARLAVRIFETIANSVASERAFSAMNLIVTKLRNRLSAEKADKLIYIYMNQRVLDKACDLLLGDWVEKSDEEQVRLEELLLSIDEEGDDIELNEDEDS
jgi:hAT family protein